MEKQPKKKVFEEPKITIVKLEWADIITTSGDPTRSRNTGDMDRETFAP